MIRSHQIVVAKRVLRACEIYAERHNIICREQVIEDAALRLLDTDPVCMEIAEAEAAAIRRACDEARAAVLAKYQDPTP